MTRPPIEPPRYEIEGDRLTERVFGQTIERAQRFIEPDGSVSIRLTLSNGLTLWGSEPSLFAPEGFED